MENLIICVGMFYIAHLFFTMSFSLHKVPFINWTYTGGDISGMTDLSSRMSSASDNLRQSLPLFLTFAVLSVVMEKGDINLLLAQVWFGLRIAYLIGAVINLYAIPMIRPLIWLPSIVVLILMGLNLCISEAPKSPDINANNAYTQDSHTSLSDEIIYYPVSVSKDQSVLLSIYDVDDQMKIIFKDSNGVIQKELEFNMGSVSTINVLDYVSTEGSTINLELTNSIAGYTFGWKLIVADQVIHEHSCGQFNSYGCDGDSYSTGIVYKAKIKLN